MKNIPNLLTGFRVLVIPFLIVVFYKYGPGPCAFTLFILASISDFLDGYLARKFKVESKFGAMMDPIADKLLTVTAMVLLLSYGNADLIPVLVILLREILVSGLREYLAANNGKMPVTNLAKWKTASQFLALTILLLVDDKTESFFGIGQIMLWLSAVLTFITGAQYCRSAYKQLGRLGKKKKKKKKGQRDYNPNIILGER